MDGEVLPTEDSLRRESFTLQALNNPCAYTPTAAISPSSEHSFQFLDEDDSFLQSFSDDGSRPESHCSFGSSGYGTTTSTDSSTESNNELYQEFLSRVHTSSPGDSAGTDDVFCELDQTAADESFGTQSSADPCLAPAEQSFQLFIASQPAPYTSQQYCTGGLPQFATAFAPLANRDNCSQPSQPSQASADHMDSQSMQLDESSAVVLGVSLDCLGVKSELKSQVSSIAPSSKPSCQFQEQTFSGTTIKTEPTALHVGSSLGLPEDDLLPTEFSPPPAHSNQNYQVFTLKQDQPRVRLVQQRQAQFMTQAVWCTQNPANADLAASFHTYSALTPTSQPKNAEEWDPMMYNNMETSPVTLRLHGPGGSLVQSRRMGTRVQEERIHHCTVPNCDKAYSKASHLKAHVRRHSGIKPYKCDWKNCEWAFSRSDELSRHRRSHTGVRPYKCSKCPKRFGRSDHLNKHLKVHEKKERNMEMVHMTQAHLVSTHRLRFDPNGEPIPGIQYHEHK